MPRAMSGRLLAYARRRAGLSQRALARKAGMPHSTVARIELGRLSPRMDTFTRLMAAAGSSLATEPSLDVGVDRTQIREVRKLTPGQRARLAAADATSLDAPTIDATMRPMRTTVTLDADSLAIVRRLMRDRGLTFKEAVNQAIRASSRQRGSRGGFRTRTFDMGVPHIPLDNALRVAAELEDEEVMRRLASRK